MQPGCSRGKAPSGECEGEGVAGEEVGQAVGWAHVRPSAEQGRAQHRDRGTNVEVAEGLSEWLGVPWLWRQAGLLPSAPVQVVGLSCGTCTCAIPA